MGEFIRVAKDLEVKEISEGVDLKFDHEENDEYISQGIGIKNEKGSREVDSSNRSLGKVEAKSRSKHDRNGRLFSCNQCDHQVRKQSSLNQHVRSVHEKVRYPCSLCEYQARTPESLRNHIDAKHDSVVWNCEQCDFQSKWKKSYYNHRKSHISQDKEKLVQYLNKKIMKRESQTKETQI